MVFYKLRRYFIFALLLCFPYYVCYALEDNEFASKNSFRVCTYNIGNFSLGETAVPSGNDKILYGLKRVFDDVHADVYMLEEWDEDFNRNSSESEYYKKSSRDVFYGKYKNANGNEFIDQSRRIVPDEYTFSVRKNTEAQDNTSIGVVNLYRGKGIDEVYKYYYEDFGLDTVNANGTEISENRKRGIIDNIVEINGEHIHFITVHFTPKYMQLRYEEMRAVINYIKSNHIEYFVIGGDFNLGISSGNSSEIDNYVENKTLREAQEVKVFMDEGYISAQGSASLIEFAKQNGYDSAKVPEVVNLEGKDYYFISTHPSRPSSFYDNIVISSNLFFKNIYTAGHGVNSISGDVIDSKGKVVSLVDEDGNPYDDKSGVYAVSDHFALVADIAFVKDKLSVTVKYIDKDTGVEIAEETILNGVKGDRYQTSSKEIDGYVLIEKPKVESNIMTENMDVVYYYESLSKSKDVSNQSNLPPSNPKTFDKTVIVLFIFIVSVGSAFFVIRQFMKNKEQ